MRLELKNLRASELTRYLYGMVLLSGMADVAKVIGFLDISRIAEGTWDPSLLLVMVGALAVYIPGFHFLIKPKLKARRAPKYSAAYHLPESRSLDRQTLFGAGIFGLGWGLVGICPGPALVNVAGLELKLGLFLLTMVFGAYLGELLKAKQPARVCITE